MLPQVTQLFTKGKYLGQCLCQPYYYDAVSAVLSSAASPLLANSSLLAGCASAASAFPCAMP